MLQRSGFRGRLAEDGFEESVSLQRDGGALSAAGEVHPGLLRARVAAAHGPGQYPLSAHVVREFNLKQFSVSIMQDEICISRDKIDLRGILYRLRKR